MSSINNISFYNNGSFFSMKLYLRWTILFLQKFNCVSLLKNVEKMFCIIARL